MKKILLTLALASAFGAVFAQQQLITNGSFETETNIGPNGYYTLTEYRTPDGWGFTPGTHTDSYAQRDSLTAEDGSWYIQLGAVGDINGPPANQSSYDTLTQSVQTVKGTSYDLSFYLNDQSGGFDFNSMWNGSVIAAIYHTIPDMWTQYSATVVGTGGMDTLSLNGFDEISGGSGYLDNVTLVQAQAVPEPKSLMLALLASTAGFLIRRRRNL